MGPKVSSNNNSEYTQLLNEYDIIKNKTIDILLLRKKGSSQQYLLKEYTYNDRKQFQISLQLLNRRKIQYAGCKHLIQIQRIFSQTQDQYCSTFYKIYTLFQWNTRTLDDQINQRNLQKKKFQEKDLWSIVCSSLIALNHLQKQTIKHQALSSQSILISQEGTVKIYDPLLISSHSNYETLLAKRGTSHFYLSPEQTQYLMRQQNPTHNNLYKSDVWTMGMILMQAGLSQYQDECYRDECSRIHWQTLQFNINRFKQQYSQSLGSLLQQMLQKQQKYRPDWFQLSEKIQREQQRLKFSERINNSSIVQPSKSKIYQKIIIKQKPLRQSIKISIPPPPISVSRTSIPPVIINRNHLYESNAYNKIVNHKDTIQTNPIKPVAVSLINNTRPNKSIFPNSVYQTETIFDENLIAVHSESQQLDNNSTNKHHSSYFDSIPKPRTEQINDAVFNHPFTTIRTNQYQEQNKSIQTNMFSPHANKTQTQQPINSPESNPQGDQVTQRYRQGSKYTGYKLNGMRHGFGTFQYQDGGMYKGQWKHNKMQGHGSLFYQSGMLAYDGEWLNDQFYGKGVLYNQAPQLLREPFDFTDFDLLQEKWTIYSGEFKQDMKDGHGIIVLSNNQQFQGTFKADLIDGQGIFTCINGNKIKGQWILNKLVK